MELSPIVPAPVNLTKSFVVPVPVTTVPLAGKVAVEVIPVPPLVLSKYCSSLNVPVPEFITT